MIKYLSICFLLILTFLSTNIIYANYYTKASIVIADLEKDQTLYKKGNIEKRISPCCTFNIALSLWAMILAFCKMS